MDVCFFSTKWLSVERMNTCVKNNATVINMTFLNNQIEIARSINTSLIDNYSLSLQMAPLFFLKKY